MFFRKIDKKKTILNVSAFLEDDFDNLRKLSKAEALIATGNPSGESREVTSNLQHYSYKQLYDTCVKAINNCSKEHMEILQRVFVKGDKNFLIMMDLNMARTTYHRHKKEAILEFADRLFEESSRIDKKYPIDFRIYGDVNENS